jgi:hypothetical protein
MAATSPQQHRALFGTDIYQFVNEFPGGSSASETILLHR